MSFSNQYAGRRVLVTGHTGFKGSWLCEWLTLLGADVFGYALPAEEGALFTQIELAARIHHQEADIRDLATLCAVVKSSRPDLIFHLAAQALVRPSYADPVKTYATNIMGTVNLLEAVRLAGHPCAVVVATSDKCYENQERLQEYREEDAMGGHDPYSSSKGAAELVVASYRKSFFSQTSAVRVASVRAGNVIGGGDYASDRIVPDCIRALSAGRPVRVRNPAATRPWQHVLEPLGGYLWLGARLQGEGADSSANSALNTAFNFGPAAGSHRSVRELVEEMLLHWPGEWQDASQPSGLHEASLLHLSADKVRRMLGWEPTWNFEETIAATVDWYRAVAADAGAAHFLCHEQIHHYTLSAKEAAIAWTQ
jgi:CDP-glucose 4,6-dehydratase